MRTQGEIEAAIAAQRAEDEREAVRVAEEARRAARAARTAPYVAALEAALGDALIRYREPQ